MTTNKIYKPEWRSETSLDGTTAIDTMSVDIDVNGTTEHVWVEMPIPSDWNGDAGDYIGNYGDLCNLMMEELKAYGIEREQVEFPYDEDDKLFKSFCETKNGYRYFDGCRIVFSNRLHPELGQVEASFPMEEEELETVAACIGMGTDNIPEIHDIECDVDYFEFEIPHQVNSLSELNELCSVLDDWDSDDIQKANAIYQVWGKSEMNRIVADGDMSDYEFKSWILTNEDLVGDYLEGRGEEHEWWAYYIDDDKLADKIQNDDDGVFTDYGYIYHI